MILECSRDRLRAALSQVERLTGKNLSLPVLANVLLEAADKHIRLRATNLDIGAEIKIPAQIEKPGRVVIRGATMISLLHSLSREEKVKLELVNDNVLISSIHHTTLLKCFPAGDYPTLPSAPREKTLFLPANLFISGLRSVFFAAATSAVKPEINSVYLYTDNLNLIFVATDSFRLAEKKISLPEAEPLELIIPARNAAEIIRMFEGTEEKLQLNFNKNQLSITGDDVYLISRLIDGVFPDYRQIMPTEAKTEVIINRNDLVENLKLANVFANKLNQIDFKVQAEDKHIEVVSQNSEIGENASRFGVTTSGEAVEMSFNVRFLLELFQFLLATEISIKFNGKNKPALFAGVGDPSFRYLVMPMHR